MYKISSFGKSVLLAERVKLALDFGCVVKKSQSQEKKKKEKKEEKIFVVHSSEHSFTF